MRRSARRLPMRHTLRAARVLVITGSMGAGKSTVMAEASDLLAASGVVHAAVDLDGLAIAHLSGGSTRDLTYRNLSAVWHNFASAGIDTLLVATAVERAADLERLRDAVGAERVIVCRLRAPVAVMQARVRGREPGMLQEQFVDRVAALESLLDQASLEDFTLVNDSRPVTEVARDMLARAGWLDHV